MQLITTGAHVQIELSGELCDIAHSPQLSDCCCASAPAAGMPRSALIHCQARKCARDSNMGAWGDFNRALW